MHHWFNKQTANDLTSEDTLYHRGLTNKTKKTGFFLKSKVTRNSSTYNTVFASWKSVVLTSIPLLQLPRDMKRYKVTPKWFH